MNTDKTNRITETVSADATSMRSAAECVVASLKKTEDIREMSQTEESKLGVFSQEIRDEVYSLVSRAYSQATDLVKYECIIPEGYVKLQPQSSHKHAAKNIQTPTSVEKKGALPAAASAILTSLGVVVDAPAFAVVLLSASGAIIGSYLQQRVSKEQYSTFEQEEFPLHMLSESEVTVKLQVNTSRREALLERANVDIDQLCKNIAIFEKRNNDKHDIEVDRDFGEWVQRFLLYADSRVDDRKLQLLRDQLLDQLARMNIHVYDEVVLDSNGEPDVPLMDYLIDSRKGDDFKKVIKPAVYSDRSLLARGEIV